MTRRRSRWPRFSRDAVLFTAGLAGIAHETVVGNADRPTLLFVFAAMVGLPAFLRSDERTQDREPPEEDEPESPPPPPRPKPKPKPRPPQRAGPSTAGPSGTPRPRPRR